MREPIAVVGMACRFPGANNLESFWDNILRDVYSIRPMPPGRLHRERYYDPQLGAYGKTYCSLGGLVDDPSFDPAPFRIPPKVIASTDIAHLNTLEVAKATFEDAGLDPFGLRGRNIGVIIGHARGSMLTADMAFSTAVEGMLESLDGLSLRRTFDKEDLEQLKAAVAMRVHDRYPKRTEDGGVGTMTSALAGLVSNVFGLTGRHSVVDAACASSFAALDIAIEALRQGHLEAALVGGSSYSQELSVIMFAQSRALSPDGSFPFDRRANGFISSDGYGLFLLKRLDDALSDGDRIRAIIRGIGGSCDGKGKALWAPRREGQILAMQRAYEDAGVDPNSVSLIEAHATSTPLGDRTELEACHELFGRHPRPMPVGSVKGNIGHCREAAGAAGLVKAILALEHGILPPTGNFREPNPEIPFRDLNVEVLTSARPFRDGPRRVAVNAFGIGGLNYHVVVEDGRVHSSRAPKALHAERGARQSRVEAVGRGADRADIAIVGLGGRFPGASNVSQFWENLRAGFDPLTDVPDDRWNKNLYCQAEGRLPYRTYTSRGGFITEYTPDWRRYGVPPKLVERNDPLQFMLLDAAMDAFADAGLDLEKIDRRRVAVIVGSVFGSDYALELSLAIRAKELAEDVQAVLARPELRGEDIPRGQSRFDTSLTFAPDGVQFISEEELERHILERLRQRLPSINEDSSGSFSSSTLASRTAKTLDLMGPAYAIDAACASSLASLEAACELLRSGRVDYAVYGGGDRAMRIQRYEAYCQFFALSKVGRPRPFDERADGFLPGEGAGACILQRLEDAQREKRRILAIIRGIGSSSDGERKSLHKPSVHGLSAAMQRALAQANVDAGAVTFVECHGGGTPLGDRTEIEAVRSVYVVPHSGKHRSAPGKANQTITPRSLVLGAVKSSVGHAQGAAGVFSIIKTTLALHSNEIPGTAGFERLHPDHETDEEDATLRVTRQLEPFPDAPPEHAPTQTQGSQNRRFAAVSSMGLGGINYHAVLEWNEGLDSAMTRPLETSHVRVRPRGRIQGVTAGEDEREIHPPLGVYRLCAKSVDDLLKRTSPSDALELFSERIVGDGPIVASMAARTSEELLASLALLKKVGADKSVEEFRDKHGLFVRLQAPPTPDRIAFLFSGQGSQYGGMMRAVADEVPDAAAIIQRVDRWLEQCGLSPLSPVIFSGEPIPNSVFLIQASVLTADLMAFASLAARKVVPDVVTGHSYGDYAALVASEAWSIEDALLATKLRSEAIERTAPPGGMMSVTANEEIVRELLKEARRYGDIELANINAPDQFIVSGTPATLEALVRLTEIRRIETKRLDVPRPFHSSLMGPTRDQLVRSFASIPLTKPRVPYLSSVSRRFEDDPERIRALLVEQLVEPVNFIEQIRRLHDEGVTVFLECGPRGALSSLTRKIMNGRDVGIAPTDDAAKPGLWATHRVLALLDARRASAAGAPSQEAEKPHAPEARAGSTLTLAEGQVAETFIQDPAFKAFWDKTQPSIVALVESLWNAEKRVSQPPSSADVAALKPEIPSAIESLASPEAPAREQVEAFLVSAICEESGYPRELISLDADLEADLGIDTVKQAQVLGRVRDHFDLRTEEKLSLRDFPTLRHIAKYVDEKARSHASSPKQRRFSPPIVDLVAKRKNATKESAEHIEAVGRAQNQSIERGQNERVELVRDVSVEIDSPQGPNHTPDTSVTVLELAGTPREMGRQHGEALREVIRETMARYEAFLGASGLTKLQVPSAIERHQGLFDENTLEELYGLSEAIGVPASHIIAYNLDAALFPSYTTGCTQAVRLGRENEGDLLHIANEDSPLFLHLGGYQPRVVQKRRKGRSSPGDVNPSTLIFFSAAGQICGPNGVSSYGLTVSSTTLLDGAPPRQGFVGLPHPQLIKRILEQAQSLAQALEIVRATRRSGRWSLLLSDADRDEAHYFEYDDDEILRDEPVLGSRVTTNHSLCGPRASSQAPEHSVFRRQRAEELLSRASKLTVTGAQDILRDRHDLGRGRLATHPTMNTVRRVDNVMSLIVEPKARKLHVTDRVVPQGSAFDGVGWMTLSYRAESNPGNSAAELSEKTRPELHAKGTSPLLAKDVFSEVELVDVEKLQENGAGLDVIPEIMARHVIRVGEAPNPSIPDEREDAALRPDTGHNTIRHNTGWHPRSVLLIGESPWTDAVVRSFTQRNATVFRAPQCDKAMTHLLSDDYDTIGFCFPPLPSGNRDFAAHWPGVRRERLERPFEILQSWISSREGGTVFAVTTLGGGLGFENVAQGSPADGGLVGLLKAIRREFPKVRAQVLDVSPTEIPDEIASALLRELDGTEQRLEVGLLRGKRRVLFMPERAAAITARIAEAQPLPKTWVVTGGARGVTARMCLRLAELYQPTFHLLGKQSLPDASVLERLRGLGPEGIEQEKRQILKDLQAYSSNIQPQLWKTRADEMDKWLEINRTLRGISERGSRVVYHAVDLAQKDEVARTFERIREDGVIEGLLHGAGFEESRSYPRKTRESFEATVGAKVDGLVHLLSLTEQDPVSNIIAFSSVSGRFGGHGQADYAMANEAMARILGAHRRQHPERRVTTISWPAFSEVGLAARASSKAMLERSGQAFMAPAEGANHFLRELWAGQPESEVTICGQLEVLDLDRVLPSWPDRPAWRQRAQAARVSPLLGEVVLDLPERLITERTLEASEPFLDQHRMGSTPILPAVVALELLFEGANFGGRHYSLAEVEILRPLKVAESGRATVSFERRGDLLRITHTLTKSDGTVLDPDRVFVVGQRVDAQSPGRLASRTEARNARVDSSRERLQRSLVDTKNFVPYPYPASIDRAPGSRAIFHGPLFRCVNGVAGSASSGRARLTATPVEALVPGTRSSDWCVPAALLDGCLQAIGLAGRLFHGVVALPAGFGRVDIAPRAASLRGREMELEFLFRGLSGGRLVCDFCLGDEDGPVVSVLAYQAQVVPQE